MLIPPDHLGDIERRVREHRSLTFLQAAMLVTSYKAMRAAAAEALYILTATAGESEGASAERVHDAATILRQFSALAPTGLEVVDGKPFDIGEWCDRIVSGVGGLNDFNRYELGGLVSQLDAVKWVLRCLANPKCEGADVVLAAIAARRAEVG